MIKTLVTGATGFLGNHLVPRLESSGHQIYICNTKTANLKNLPNLITHYEGVKFDYIFHLAAVTKAGDYCLKHPGTQWIENQIINTNILAYWADHQPNAKMICMGTSCSYAPDIFMKEENYLLGQPEPSLYAYAMTKRMLLLGLQSIEKEFGLKWLYFIPSTLYGPGFELDDNHFIFDFIRNCYNAKNKGEKFVVWGDGEQRRELIYVDDAMDTMMKLIPEENQVFNLGSGEDHSINEFAKMVCKCYDYDEALIEHDLTKYVGVKEKKIDTAKVVSRIPQEEFLKTSLESGLHRSVNYFNEEMKKQC
tara:strand:+ start:248 stop:1168 length:921 start_codon:yes stop_codon:yes gene_type:complete